MAPVCKVIESSIDFDHEIKVKALRIGEPVITSLDSTKTISMYDDKIQVKFGKKTKLCRPQDGAILEND